MIHKCNTFNRHQKWYKKPNTKTLKKGYKTMKKEYGYCRVSTKKQNIERQERNIKAEYPNAIIIKEEYTGTKLNRPEFTKLIKVINEEVKKGNEVTLIFDSVSRMSRNAEEGFTLYQELFDKGIEIVFLKEHYIDTKTYRTALNNKIDLVGNEIADEYIKATNNVLMILARQQIEIAFGQSEKEVQDLQQRTKEGIETARRNGKQIGQKTGVELKIQKEQPIKELIKKYSKTFEGNLNDPETISIINGKRYVYTYPSGKTEEKVLHISRNTYYKYKAEILNELIEEYK